RTRPRFDVHLPPPQRRALPHPRRRLSRRAMWAMWAMWVREIRGGPMSEPTITGTAQVGLEIPNAVWLTSNQRLHWADKAKRTAAIRQLAASPARNARIEPMMQVHVAAFIGYPTSAKADPP